jgi:hypothetical protein
MYQLPATHALPTADVTTNTEREQIRFLARQLDGIEIRDSLIPSGSLEASRLIRSLQKRVERKHQSGVRSSLAFLYAQ